MLPELDNWDDDSPEYIAGEGNGIALLGALSLAAVIFAVGCALIYWLS